MENKSIKNSKIKIEDYKSIIDNLNDGISILDDEGRHLYVNDTFQKMIGFTYSEIYKMTPPFHYWPEEEIGKITKAFSKTLKGYKNYFELKFMRKNGDRFPALISVSQIKNSDNKVLYNIGTVKDITEIRNTQKLLKDTVIKYRSHLDQSPIAFQIYNKDGGINFVNKAWQNLWGYSNTEADLIRKNYNVLEDKQLVEIGMLDYVKNAFNGKVQEPHTVMYDSSKTIKQLAGKRVETKKRWVTSRLFPVIIDGKIEEVVLSMIDDTDKILAEQQLKSAMKDLIEVKSQVEKENIYLKEEIENAYQYENLIYSSDVISKVLDQVEMVAETNVTVLIQGETGTGKEIIARALHKTSPRNNKPLIRVNCSAIPNELIESELFGHKKGSFTGAVNDRIGKFELADGGTIFLDEIGELPFEMQPKLLRVLQEGEIDPIGSSKTLKLNVRVIAATNRNLIKEVKNKRFREDLFFRLNVFPIIIPPLRERPEDIPVLVQHFIKKYSSLHNKEITQILNHDLDKLKLEKWPGNVRELEHLIERSIILSKTEVLKIDGFHENRIDPSSTKLNNMGQTLDDVQRQYIIKVLGHVNWKINGDEGAAKILNLSPSTLRDRMKKLNIKRP